MDLQANGLPTARAIVENPLSHLPFCELAKTFLTVSGVTERQLAAEAKIARGRMARLLNGARDFTEEEAARTRAALSLLSQKKAAQRAKLGK